MRNFGIWEFDENFGIIGRPENYPEHYITVEKLWETTNIDDNPVWKWPVHLTVFSWFTIEVARDFNKAFFYAQEYFEGQRPVDSPEMMNIDAETISHQEVIYKDYYPGINGELVGV